MVLFGLLSGREQPSAKPQFPDPPVWEVVQAGEVVSLVEEEERAALAARKEMKLVEKAHAHRDEPVKVPQTAFQPEKRKSRTQLSEPLGGPNFDGKGNAPQAPSVEGTAWEKPLVHTEDGHRAFVEAEARRIAAEALRGPHALRRQLDESRRLAAVEAFVRRAAAALHEREQVGQLRRATLTIGVLAASQLLDQTLRIEAAGGLLRNDGSGQRRTPGGVFLGVLLRENLSKEEYKHIQAAKPLRGGKVILHRSGGWAYLRGGPGGATSENVSRLLAKAFGPVASDRLKLKLRTAQDGTAFGKVAFLRAADRAAALAQGVLMLPSGGCFVIEAAPTAGLHTSLVKGGSGGVSAGAGGGGGGAEGDGDEEEDDWFLIDDVPAADGEGGGGDRGGGDRGGGEPAAEENGDAPGGEGAVAEWVPDELICPITLERLRDPVIAVDGHTYEREALQGWLDRHSATEIVRSPATGAVLSKRTLTTNDDLVKKLGGAGRAVLRSLQ